MTAGEFVPQDLDIYVTSDKIATILVFLNEQGYNIHLPPPSSTRKQYPTSTIVLTLKNRTGEKIDLIATTEPHVVHAITKFHSTCVMNYISYNGIVCLYPEWTMRNKGFVRAGVVDQQSIDKYRGRGFAMVYTSEELPGYEAEHKCGTHPCCPKARRELHDYATLFIPLDDEDLNIETEEKMRVGWVLQKMYTCHE